MSTTPSPDDLVTVAAAVGPSLVIIGRDGRGSGVVIDTDAVLTNAHNLRDRTTTVTFADGATVAAELVGADADGDLVVLRAETGDRPAIRLAEEVPSTLGSPVFTATVAGAGTRVTAGMVSATEQTFSGPRGRTIRGSIEHTAPVPRGGSGSPVTDAGGAVVGVNTHRLDGGFYLAQPADAAFRDRLGTLRSGQPVERRRLGAGLAPPAVARRLRRAVGLPDRDGLLVRVVQEGSPAERAGVAEGDLLVTADGAALDSVDALHAVLDAGPPTRSFRLGIVRGTEDLELTVDPSPVG